MSDVRPAASTTFAWLDAGRIVAVCAVVTLHASAPVVMHGEFGSSAWWAGNVYDSISRWSVPAFVMISGALLLEPGKTEDTFAFYRRRMDRIVVPLVVWTIVFIGWTAWTARVRDEFSGRDAVDDIIDGQPYYHLWYLYMLLGLYLFAPVVSAAVRQLPRRETWFFVGAVFLLAAADEWRGASYNTGDRMFIVWFLPFLGYFVVGHLLATTERRVSRGLVLSAFALTVVATAFGCYLHVRREGTDDGFYLYGYLSVTVIPMAIALMLALRSCSFSPAAATRLHKLAALTLGVYVLHPLFLDAVRMNFSVARVYPWVSVPVLSLLVVVASAAVTAALRAVPLVRRAV